MIERKIFIAAPLFTEAERTYNLKIDNICRELGFVTFMAQRDVGIVTKASIEEVFQQDLENLRQADIIVANLDGIDVDSGTAWELGYAFANSKPIICIRTDVRMYRDFLSVNLMVRQSGILINSLDELSQILLKYKYI